MVAHGSSHYELLYNVLWTVNFMCNTRVYRHYIIIWWRLIFMTMAVCASKRAVVLPQSSALLSQYQLDLIILICTRNLRWSHRVADIWHLMVHSSSRFQHTPMVWHHLQWYDITWLTAHLTWHGRSLPWSIELTCLSLQTFPIPCVVIISGDRLTVKKVMPNIRFACY